MKKLVTSYTFDASEKTITAADFETLDAILLITNVIDNIIIYNFADATTGGILAETTLTLKYDTANMSDTDGLQIFIDDGKALSTALKQDSQIALETTLESLVDTLHELTQRLAPLGGAIANVGGSALRTQGVGTFAVSGPQTSANFIASHNIAGVNYPEKVALTNLTAVQSNIANCTGG